MTEFEHLEFVWLFIAIIPLIAGVVIPYLFKKYLLEDKYGAILGFNCFLFALYAIIFFNPNGHTINKFWLYPLVSITLYPYAMKKHLEYKGETQSKWYLLLIFVHVCVWLFILSNFRLDSIVHGGQ